jgi:hypothetical protein
MPPPCPSPISPERTTPSSHGLRHGGTPACPSQACACPALSALRRRPRTEGRARPAKAILLDQVQGPGTGSAAQAPRRESLPRLWPALRGDAGQEILLASVPGPAEVEGRRQDLVEHPGAGVHGQKVTRPARIVPIVNKPISGANCSHLKAGPGNSGPDSTLKVSGLAPGSTPDIPGAKAPAGQPAPRRDIPDLPADHDDTINLSQTRPDTRALARTSVDALDGRHQHAHSVAANRLPPESQSQEVAGTKESSIKQPGFLAFSSPSR